jgi:hypothetical protein
VSLRDILDVYPKKAWGLEFTRTDTLVVRILNDDLLGGSMARRAKSPSVALPSGLGTLSFELNFARELA